MNTFAHFAGKVSISISSHLRAYNAVLSDGSGSWIIDTGASDHMTHDSFLPKRNCYLHLSMSPYQMALKKRLLKLAIYP